jgi:hypothetical protein
MAVNIDPHTLYTLADIADLFDVSSDQVKQAADQSQLKGAKVGSEFYVRGDHLLEYFGTLVAQKATAFAAAGESRASGFLSASEMDSSMPKVLGGKVKEGELSKPAPPPPPAPKAPPAPHSQPPSSGGGMSHSPGADSFPPPQQSRAPIGAPPQQAQPSFNQPPPQQPRGPIGAAPMPQAPQSAPNNYQSMPTGAFNFTQPPPSQSDGGGQSNAPIPGAGFGQQPSPPGGFPAPGQHPPQPPQQHQQPQQQGGGGDGRRPLSYDPDELLRQVEDLERQRKEGGS